MVRKSQLFILIFSTLGLSFLSTSAWASPATLKCNSNRDQVWVYDSLNSFNVDAKLKCGQGVEIIERLPNYVKIRAQNGVEGYVPDAAVAGLLNLSALSRFRARRRFGCKTIASCGGCESGSARRLSSTRRCELRKSLASFSFWIVKLRYRGSRKDNNPRQYFDGATTCTRRTETGLGHLIGSEGHSFICSYGTSSRSHFARDFSVATRKPRRRVARRPSQRSQQKRLRRPLRIPIQLLTRRVPLSSQTARAGPISQPTA